MNEYFSRPIFVLGLPRSGTSLIAGILGICGAWLGKTVPPCPESNPKGFFENIHLREGVNKAILRQCGCDPMGVSSLPALDGLPAVPHLEAFIHKILLKEGYRGDRPWLLKDAKLTLLWPIYSKAFPDAKWVIVRRNDDEIISSCCRTHFMQQHSTDRQFWQGFIQEYMQRLEALKSSGVDWREVWPADVVSGNYTALETLAGECGLSWNEVAVQDFISIDAWHGHSTAE